MFWLNYDQKNEKILLKLGVFRVKPSNIIRLILRKTAYN